MTTIPPRSPLTPHLSPVPLNDVERNNYLSLAEHLGIPADRLRPIERMTIDGFGRSPEAAAALGDGAYLQQSAIIVRREQLPPAYTSPAFRDEANGDAHDIQEVEALANDALRQDGLSGIAELVLGHTKAGAYAGQMIDVAGGCVVHTGVAGKIGGLHLASLAQSFGIRVPEEALPLDDGTPVVYAVLDTALGDVRKAKGLVATVEGIPKDLDTVLNRRRVQQLRRDYGRAYRIFGDLRHVDLGGFTMTFPLTSPVRLDGTDLELYVVPSPKTGEGKAVLFSESGDSHGFDRLPKNPDVIFGRDSSSVIDALFTGNAIAYDKERGSRRIDRIEEDVMVQYGHWLQGEPSRFRDWAKHSDESDEKLAREFVTCGYSGFKRYSVFRRLSERMDMKADRFKQLLHKDWSRLRDVLYNNTSPGTLPPELRVNLLYPAADDDIATREMLARITPDDHTERFIYFREGFEKDVAKADKEKRKAIINRLTKYNEEHPDARIAEWLAQLPPEAPAEAPVVADAASDALTAIPIDAPRTRLEFAADGTTRITILPREEVPHERR